MKPVGVIDDPLYALDSFDRDGLLVSIGVALDAPDELLRKAIDEAHCRDVDDFLIWRAGYQAGKQAVEAQLIEHWAKLRELGTLLDFRAAADVYVTRSRDGWSAKSD
jgi:hypothetical protein